MSTRYLHVEWRPANAPDVPSDDFDECPESQFLAVNRHDREVCDAVRLLDVGDSVTLGGGAQPVVIVTVLR